MHREVEAPAAAAAAAAACANRLPVARAPVILGDAHSSAGHRLLQPKHSRVWGVRNVSALCSSAQACSKAGTTQNAAGLCKFRFGRTVLCGAHACSADVLGAACRLLQGGRGGPTLDSSDWAHRVAFLSVDRSTTLFLS